MSDHDRDRPVAHLGTHLTSPPGQVTVNVPVILACGSHLKV